MVQLSAVPEDKRWLWGDFVRGRWNLIAFPLALIILVDLTARLVEWPALLNWVAEQYAMGTAWILSFSPITIPLEWNNYVVLLCVFFGVTNASYHRKTGDSFVVDLLSFELSRPLFENNPQRITFQNKSWGEQLDDFAAVVTSSGMIIVIAFVPTYCFLTFMSFFIKFHTATMVPYGKWLFILAVILGSGLFIAWRWILTTGLCCLYR